MDKKELSFVKRAFGSQIEPCAKLARSCYVDVSSNKLYYQDPVSIPLMDESELSQYTAIFKKGVSGKLGATGIDIPTTGDSLLGKLKNTELKDSEMFRTLCESIADAYATTENYCILASCGTTDIPGEFESDYELDYVLVQIIPCPLSKPGIIYDFPKNQFTENGKYRTLTPPYYSILYPSMVEMKPDYTNAFLVSKTVKSMSEANGIAVELLGSGIPLSAEQQVEGFKMLMEEAFDNLVPYEDVCRVYEKLGDLALDADVSGENKAISAQKLSEIIAEDSNEKEEKMEAMQGLVKSFSGSDFMLSNLLPKKTNIKTPRSSISVAMADLSMIEKRQIDGRMYYLVPADEATIEDIPIQTKK